MMHFTVQQPSTASDAAKGQARNRGNEAILRRGKELVGSWSMQIEHLQNGMQQAAEVVRDETQQQIQNLTAVRDEAVSQLDQLKEATEENSDMLRKQTDELLQALSMRFEDLQSRQGRE